MGGHCSQKLCPGGDCTPLRGAADLRINTRSTTLSQRSDARGLVSQAFSSSPASGAVAVVVTFRRPVTIVSF